MLKLRSINEGCGAIAANSVKIFVNRAAEVDNIKTWLANFGVIVFPNQALTPIEFRQFSGFFGSVRKVGRAEARLPGYNDIAAIVTNAVSEGNFGISHVGTYWHTDLSYEKNPPAFTCLYCVESSHHIRLVTGFSSLKRAFEAVPEDIKAKWIGYSALHDLAMSDKGDFPGRSPHQPRPIKDRRSAIAYHNLVKRHPRTGESHLYFNPGLVSHVFDDKNQEDEGMLDFLKQHVTEKKFQYLHEWKEGDLVIWDNRVVLHKAPSNYAPSDRRYLWRTVIDENGI